MGNNAIDVALQVGVSDSGKPLITIPVSILAPGFVPPVSANLGGINTLASCDQIPLQISSAKTQVDFGLLKSLSFSGTVFCNATTFGSSSFWQLPRIYIVNLLTNQTIVLVANTSIVANNPTSGGGSQAFVFNSSIEMIPSKNPTLQMYIERTTAGCQVGGFLNLNNFRLSEVN